jgi:hypothetical protein
MNLERVTLAFNSGILSIKAHDSGVKRVLDIFIDTFARGRIGGIVVFINKTLIS